MSNQAIECNIAPPPPKKRMLLKSFEEDKTRFETQQIILNKSENAFPISSNAVKQPRTYSRRRKNI